MGLALHCPATPVRLSSEIFYEVIQQESFSSKTTSRVYTFTTATAHRSYLAFGIQMRGRNLARSGRSGRQTYTACASWVMLARGGR